jgi:crossover junction endodeoxyribonuclease RuvC
VAKLILGIDPGLKNTGFGLIKQTKTAYVYVESGIIVTCPKTHTHQRLVTIFNGLRTIIERYQPNDICLEKVFVNINPKTTLLLGQARGVAMCASAIDGCSVYEYSALQIKKSVVGYGHASKLQMQEMVKYLLKLNALPAVDASDALACAITHSHMFKFLESCGAK